MDAFSVIKRTKGFTLAEVLITLGIIGIVAAMTMPMLIQNYQKNLTAVRLKHFSSTMQQAARMREKDNIEGNLQILSTDDVDAFNPDDMEKYFNIYWKPYIKILSTTKMTKGLFVKFPNGTGAYMQRSYKCPNEGVTCNMYMAFCPQYKYCENIDEGTSYRETLKRRYVFAFWQGGTVPREYTYAPYTRTQLLERCKTDPYYCSSLIEVDGWTIKDDYPWK